MMDGKVYIIFVLILCFVASCCSLKASQEEQFQRNVFNINKSIVSVSSNINVRIRNTETSSAVFFDNNTIGTGFVVKHEENFTYILTAGHLCDIFKEVVHIKLQRRLLDIEEIGTIINIYVNFQNGAGQVAYPFLVAENYDVCVLITKKISIPTIPISKNSPEVGKKYFSGGFPVGAGHSSINFVPLFEGFYIGEATNPHGHDNDVFTIPVGPGSSGSPVFDFDGFFVSVVHSQNGRFNQILYGATLKQISEGLDLIDKIPLKNKEIYFKLPEN